MVDQIGIPQERIAIVFPPVPIPGALVVAVRENRLQELQRLEQERLRRTWRVRGVISDHVPLIGSVADALVRPPHHMFALNENPLSIYLHHGGNNAVYYDFVGDETGRLQYIEVRVETDLPSNAFLYARQPLNEILDAMSRTQPQMPLVLQHLELVSPDDDGVVAVRSPLLRGQCARSRRLQCGDLLQALALRIKSALRTLRIRVPARRIGVSPVSDLARRRDSLPTDAGHLDASRYIESLGLLVF